MSPYLLIPRLDSIEERMLVSKLCSREKFPSVFIDSIPDTVNEILGIQWEKGDLHPVRIFSTRYHPINYVCVQSCRSHLFFCASEVKDLGLRVESLDGLLILSHETILLARLMRDLSLGFIHRAEDNETVGGHSDALRYFEVARHSYKKTNE